MDRRFSVFIIARKAWQVFQFVWPNLGIPLLLIFYYFKKSVNLNLGIMEVYTDFFLVFSTA